MLHIRNVMNLEIYIWKKKKKIEWKTVQKSKITFHPHEVKWEWQTLHAFARCNHKSPQTPGKEHLTTFNQIQSSTCILRLWLWSRNDFFRTLTPKSFFWFESHRHNSIMNLPFSLCNYAIISFYKRVSTSRSVAHTWLIIHSLGFALNLHTYTHSNQLTVSRTSIVA